MNAAASPFAAGGSLFKTVSGESMQAAPIQNSPFAAQGAPSTNSPLTVGDVLPQLPPELARANGLSMDQPVAVSAQVLDAALRSGQAALPIFEIYRVCPALFVQPVSPQDPRMVPLPASKLPRLIASAQQAVQSPTGLPPAMAPAGAPAPSPFAAMGAPAPAAGGSPFAAMQPPGGGMGTILPPKRNGPPPPLADVPREAAPSLNLPGNGNAPVFPASPFSTVAPAANGGGGAIPTMTARPPEPPNVIPPSLFSVPAGAPASAPAQPPVSPFGALVPPAGAPSAGPAAAPSLSPSPFAAFTPAAAPAPAPAPAVPPQGPPNGESPFSSLFGQKAVPTGQPAPDVTNRSTTIPAALPNLSAPQAPAGGGPNVRVGLASLLKGYTVAELGFDPVMVPSWIMTSLPAVVVRDWSQSPTPLVELGLLIDGITDVGFRNVLNNAKRDFQLRVSPEEVQNALTGGAAPTLPNLASLGGGTPVSPPVGLPTMRVEPPANGAMPSMSGGASLFAPAPPPEPAPAPASPPPMSGFGFTPTPAPAAPPAEPSVPLFSTAGAPPASPFGSMAAAQPPAQAPAAAPAGLFTTLTPPPAPPEAAPPPSSFGASPFQLPTTPPPVSNPFAAPAPSGPLASDGFAPPVEPQRFSPPPATPEFEVQAPDPFQPISAPPPPPPVVSAPFTPPLAPETVRTVPVSRPEPFSTDGFSSAQLMGASPAMFEPIPAAPTGPLTNPFTGKVPTAIVDVPEEPPPPPAFIPPAAPERPVPKPASSFVPPQPKPEAEPAPMPSSFSAPRSAPASVSPTPRSGAGSPALGIQSHDSNPDQILLRALLGTDEELSSQAVVERVCLLPGIAACVCLHGDQAISHVGAHKPQAREFQRQATDLAHHLRTLAPLIGIEGAETFTLTSGDRLMTFCFPEGAILGVLHDAEPSLGLRDKITLIARELSRMLR